jgi:hypothetical protein
MNICDAFYKCCIAQTELYARPAKTPSYFVCRLQNKAKHQHWCGFSGVFGLGTAPVLAFHFQNKFVKRTILSPATRW